MREMIESRRQEQIDVSQATIFRLPVAIANFMLACSILCMGLPCFLLYQQLFHPEPGYVLLFTLGPVLFAAAAFYTFRSSLRFRDSIAVNEEGILYISRYAKSVYLPWSQVASIDVHESQQRLVLRDSTRQRQIRLEYQIEEFSKLRDFVLSHASAIQKPYGAGQNVFHRSWYNKSILIVGATFFLFLAFHFAMSFGSFAFFSASGFASLVLVFRDPTGVRITTHAIEITYLGWKRSVAFPEITGISLKNIRDDKGNVWAAVIVDRLDNKPIKLLRFREGSIALRDALISAWKAAGH